MYSPHQKKPIRLWWRRQIFHLRRSFFLRFLLLSLTILLLIIILFNPFSSYYEPIPIKQTADWRSIEELLQTKEQVRSKRIRQLNEQHTFFL